MLVGLCNPSLADGANRMSLLYDSSNLNGGPPDFCGATTMPGSLPACLSRADRAEHYAAVLDLTYASQL